MLSTAVGAVAAAVAAALAAVLAAAVRAFGEAGVAYLRQKQEELINRMGAEQYDRSLSLAREAWYIVDEYFRITPNVEKTMQAKQEKFAEEIKKLLPAVTDEEIGQLRQAIAGEVNRAKALVSTGSGGDA